MKNFIAILLLAFIGLGTYAQSTMKTIASWSVTEDVWKLDKTWTDTTFSINSYRDSVQLPIYVSVADSMEELIELKISEVTSPARVITQYQARRSVHDAWTTDKTITYTGVGTDSTQYITGSNTYKSWAYKRLLLLYVTNKAKVSFVYAQFKK